MARRHHYKRRTKPEHELDVTTFLNLMVVLVPFLLITAVFSQLTIVELNLPSSAGGASSADNFRTGEPVLTFDPPLENFTVPAFDFIGWWAILEMVV